MGCDLHCKLIALMQVRGGLLSVPYTSWRTREDDGTRR